MPVTDAERRWQKQHRLRKLRGETAYVDSTAVRLHLATLTGAGWSLRSIAGVSGHPVSSLSRIHRGHPGRVRPAMIRDVCAIRPDQIPVVTDNPAAEPFVSRVGTVRRLQGLLWNGWGHAQLRERCGTDTANILHQQGRWVTLSTHNMVAALYDELWDKRGPSGRARTWAIKQGHQPPAAWDDIDHDPEPPSPGELDDEVDEAAILRRLDGDKSVKVTPVEAAEVVRRWIASGRSWIDCERTTGLPPDRHKVA